MAKLQKAIAIKVSPEAHTQIAAKAQEHGLTISNYCRKKLTEPRSFPRIMPVINQEAIDHLQKLTEQLRSLNLQYPDAELEVKAIATLTEGIEQTILKAYELIADQQFQ